MTGVDTNILVRHITQDDPDQSPVATRLLENSFTENNPGFVSIATLLETVWVLESVFQFPVLRIAEAMERTLQLDALIIQHAEAVFLALYAYRAGAASFTDALIGELGLEAGCTHTLTFDRKASRLRAFKLMS
jgi:predicted nucleic-acid-binding protein